MHTLQKRPSAVNALSTKSVIGALDRHVQVAECAARGYLTMYQDLLVLVEPTVENPTALQLEACVREAEKLATMLKTLSPRVTADLSLSTLLSAKLVHEPVVNSASSSSSGVAIIRTHSVAVVTVMLTVTVPVL